MYARQYEIIWKNVFACVLWTASVSYIVFLACRRITRLIVDLRPKRKETFKEIVQSSKSDDLSVKQILLQWSRKALQNYSDINIQDFSSSWKDGKAFLALIHKKRPDLIDYKTVSKRSARQNLEMAFNTAEKELGVPKLIEPEDVMSGNIDEKSMMTYVASLFELQPSEEEPDHQLTLFKELYADLFTNLNSSLDDMNDEFNKSDFNIEFNHSKLESNYLMHLKQFESFQQLYSEISKTKSLPAEYEKKFHTIVNLWSKFETNSKEKSLLLANESKKVQRSERISKSLEADCNTCCRLIEDIKLKTKKIPILLPKTPNKEMNEYIRAISKEIYDIENQINNMIISVQDLRQDGYPADQHYRKIINMNGVIGKVKKEFERMCPVAVSPGLTNERQYTTMASVSLDNSPSSSSLDTWTNWIEEKQMLVSEIHFSQDTNDILQNYESFQTLFDEVKNYEDKLKNVLDSDDNRLSDPTSFQSRYESVKSQFNELWEVFSVKDREFKAYIEFSQRCVDSMNWIKSKEDQQINWPWFDSQTMKLAEKQEKFKNLIDELEMKETSINETIAVGTTLIMNNHSGTGLIQKSLANLKSEWQWILNLTHCLKTHLENLAVYEQFFYEAQEVDNVILELTDLLNTRFFRPMGVSLDEGEILNREIRDMLETIENYKETVNRLVAISQNVSAVSVRTAAILSDKKVTVKAICSSKEMPDTYSRQFTEGELLQLVNNSNARFWKVSNSKNEIISGPSICFLVTDISPQAAQTATTLDSHWKFLKDLWSKRELQLREQVLYATMDVVKNWTTEDFCSLNPSNRQKIVEILNQDANRLILDLKCAKAYDNEVSRFQMALNQCNARFAELAHGASFSETAMETEIRVMGNEKLPINRESFASVELQLDDLINTFTAMQNHLGLKLASQVILDVDLLEEQVCKHKDFETELKNYEIQVNDLILFVKNGAAETTYLKPKLESMVDLWERLWNEAHMFVIKLKSTEIFFSQLDEIDQIICEVELTLINQHESFPAGMDQIKILIAQLEAAQDNVSSVMGRLQEAPANLDQLINSVSMGRHNQKDASYDDVQKLKKELKSIEFRYELLKNQIKKRLKHANECSNQYGALKNELKTVQTWIIGLQTTVKSQLNLSNNYLESRNTDQMEKKINNYLAEISANKPEIEEINKSGSYFLNLLQKYEDLFKGYQNEIQNQMGANSQDYYGFNKRTRIQNARDWVTAEINKLNNDFNTLSEQLTKMANEYLKKRSSSAKQVLRNPERINTFQTEHVEINRYKELVNNLTDQSIISSLVKSPKSSISSNGAVEIVSNLNRCQLSNLWYFSNLLSENFSPISIGDCFRFRFIKLDSNQSTNTDDEPSVTLEDSYKEGMIMKKTFTILTTPQIFNNDQTITIVEMMKLNVFNIFNGTINIDCFSEPLTISKATSIHLIDAQLGAYLNCLMISSVELIHASPNITYAIYSPHELNRNPPLISISDSVDLNFFNPISNNQARFIDPISRKEYNYSDAIRMKFVTDQVAEIASLDSRGNPLNLTPKEAIKSKIFDSETGSIFDHNLKHKIPLHYARQEGILAKPSSLLQIVLEKDQSSILSDSRDHNRRLTDAIKQGLIDGNSEFVIKSGKWKTFTIAEAIKSQIITEQGKLLMDNDNVQMSFIDAFNKGLVRLHEHIVSGPNRDITHPNLDHKLSLVEAISMGIIDAQTAKFINIESGEQSSLQNASENKFLSKSLLKDLTVYCGLRNQKGDKLNILQAISQDLIDMKLGLIRDPLNNRWISINEAFQQNKISKNQYNRLVFLTCPLIKFSVSIEEIAINIDQAEYGLLENAKLIRSITAVFDSITNEFISLEEALNKNIINEDLGLYYHESSRVYYSLSDAIDEQLVQTDADKAKEKILEIKSMKSEKTKSYSIHSVYNSITNEWVSARQAVEDGIIDHLTGNYKAINEFGFEIDIPLNEAITTGFIKATDEEEILVTDEYKIIGFKNPMSDEIFAPIDAIERGLVDRKFERFYNTKTHEFITINEAKQLGFVITEKIGSGTEKTWTLNELITAGLIDFDSGLISFTNNDIVVSLNDAINMGQIDVDRSMLKHPDTGRHINLREAIANDLFDPVRCEIKDDYDNIITLTDAINENLFPEHVPTAVGKITFEEALEQGYINLKTNTFHDPRTGEEYSVDEAISKNILDHPQSSMSVYLTDRSKIIENKTLQIPNEESYIGMKMVETSESIKRDYKMGTFDYNNIKSVRDTLTNEDIHLDSAIDRGLIKVHDNTFLDRKSGKILPIETACKMGFVSSHKPMKILTFTDSANETITGQDFLIIDPNSGKQMSVDEAIKANVYDPVDRMIHSQTNDNYYSWNDSVKLGYIVDSSGNIVTEEKILQRNCIVYNFYYVHKGVDVIAKLTDQMIQENQIDPINHTIKDPKTGQQTTLADGLENGSVFATIMTLTNRSLYFENLNKRHDNYQIISVYDPRLNQLISYQEAINKKIINIVDATYTNYKSNEISSLSDALQHGLLHTVMKTRQHCPLSFPFTNVHIRTIEEEMNLSVPENIPEDVLIKEKRKESKKLEELSNTISPTIVNKEQTQRNTYDPQILEGNQSDAPDIAQRYVDSLKNELATLTAIENLLLKETTIHLNEKENQLLLDECQDISNEFSSKKEPILTLVHQVEKFIAKKYESVSPDVDNELQALTNELKSKTNQIQNEINNRSRLLISIIDEYDQFSNRLTDCNATHDKLDQLIDSIAAVHRIDKLEAAIVDLKSLDGDLTAYNSEVRIFNSFKLKFVEKIEKFDDIRKKFISNLQRKFDTSCDSVDGIHREIDQSINSVNDQLKNIQNKYKSKLAQLKEAMDNVEKLKEQQIHIDNIVDETKSQLDRINATVQVPSSHHLLPFVDVLHRLNGEIFGISRLVDTINECKSNTIKCLYDIGIDGENIDSLTKSINYTVEKFKSTNDRLQDLLKNVNQVSVSENDTNFSIDNLDNWLREIDRRLNDMGALSLDQKTLMEQERSLQKLHAEINSRMPNLENLLKSADARNVTRINELDERTKQKSNIVSETLDKINEIRVLLDSFHSTIASCSNWITLTTELLSDRMFIRLDNDNFHDKLQDTKNEFQQKQKDIDRVKQLAKQLVNQPDCKDQNSVENAMKTLDKVWASLSDLINTRTNEWKDRQRYSEKYSALKSKIVDKLTSWEQTLSANSPLAIDLVALQIQLDDIEHFIAEWTLSKNEIGELCLVGSEYDSILQGFPLGGNDANYRVTSPQRKSSKLKTSSHFSTPAAIGASKALCHQPCGHYSGSESSGVSSADYVNLNQEFSEVILEMNDAKSRYAEIGDRLLNRKSDISTLFSKCQTYDKDYKEFSDKLDEHLKRLLSPEVSNLSKSDEIAYYEKIDEDVRNLRPTLVNILSFGKELLRNRELVPGGVELKSNMDLLEKKFNSLKESVKKQLMGRRNIGQQMKKFNDLKKSIENSIMRKERMLNVLGPVGTSVSYGTAQLEQVNALIDEVDGLKNDVKEMNDLGQEIIRTMSPTLPEINEIEAAGATLTEKINILHKSLKERESTINSIMGPSKNFYQLVNSANDQLMALQEKIESVDDNILTSSNWHEFQSELDTTKAILQESEQLSKTLLNSTSDENAHYEIKNKIGNVLRHCRDIQSKIDHGVNVIDKRSQQEDKILHKIDDAQQWLERTQQFLNDECSSVPMDLSENIRQLQVLKGDLKHKKSQLSDLSSEMGRINEDKSPTHKSVAINDKLRNLEKLVDKLEQNTDELNNHYQQASNNLSKINNESNKIEAWIDIEKHKLNKQYPVGLDSVDAEVRLLESTMQSIDNKYQQVRDLKTLINPLDNVDSKVLLLKNLSSVSVIESNLKDLQSEADDKLKSVKELHEQISLATDNLNDLKASISKLENKWADLVALEDSGEQPVDYMKLESNVKELQSSLHQIKPDITNTKAIIGNIAEISQVNAHLLEPELDKISTRYQTLSGNFVQKLNSIHAKHKAIDECKNRIDILATRQKNLKEKIENFPQPSLDLDSLEDQIQDLTNLNREIADMEKSLILLTTEIDTLAGQNIDSADKVKLKIGNLNSANEQIAELIDDRQNSLRMQHNLVTDFESRKGDFNRKLEEANNDPELNKLLSSSSKNINAFTAQKIEPLKKQLEQVVDIGNQACSTVVSGLGFKHIEQEMEQAKHNFDKLMQIVSDIENNVDKKLMKEKKFDTTLKNLKDFVENVSKELDAEEDPSIEYHKGKSQLNSHRLLLDRLKNRQSSLDELNKIGSDLLSGMKEPKKSEWEHQLDELNKTYENLLNIAEDKNCRFDRAVKLSKTFKDCYEPSLVWLDAAEKNLASFDTSPTIDAAEMEKRIKDYQTLVNDVKAHEETLEHLNQVGEDLMKISTDNDSAAINNKINTLRNYFDEISLNAIKKKSMFENSIPIAERFLLANNKLDLVLPSLTALIRENDTLTGPMGDRNMEIIENETNAIEKLVGQARTDLDQLKSIDAFENSLEKMEDVFNENEKTFKEVLNEVTKRAIKIGSNRTKAKIQEEKLEECSEQMVDMEKKINELNDKINSDYSQLDQCKEEYQTLLAAWNDNKDAINADINDSKKLIRQAPSSDLKSLRSTVDRVKKQSQNITKGLESQQQKLDEAIPLANEYTSSYNKLKDWLMETEENMYQNKINNLDPDQLHKAEQDIKALANAWEDQKPLLDIIIKAGQPLSQIINRVQGKNIMANIDDAKKRYNNIKEFIKTRATDLEDIILLNTELNEKVDQCANQLENIRDRMTDCYQPSVHPEKLEEELLALDEISSDLEKLDVYVNKLQTGIEDCSQTNQKKFHNANESIEILDKLSNISNSNKQLLQQAMEYKDQINKLLYSANLFWNGVHHIDDKVNKIAIDLNNSTIEDLDAKFVTEKKEMIEMLRNELEIYNEDIAAICKSGAALVTQVNNANETPDVEQAEEELKRNFEIVRNSCDQKLSSIDKQEALIVKLEDMRMQLDEWFREQHNRLFTLGPLPTETRPVLNQIEKTKELKNEIEPKHRDIELINQLGYQLAKNSHPNIKNQVNHTLVRINDSWARLLDGLGQRQHQLQCILLSLGEFHRAVDEFMEWIINTEKSLSTIKVEHGDITSLEMGLAQHKMIRADMNIQQASVSQMERKAAEIIKEDVSNLGHEATQRLEQLNKSWNLLKEHIRTKHFELEDALKEALIFYGDQQELTKNIDELGNKLNLFKFSGSLPDTAKEQLKRFMDIYQTFPTLNAKVERFVEDAKELEKLSSPSIKEIINNDCSTLVQKWNALKSLAESRKGRLEKAIETVELFHLDMAKFINWLTITEKNLNQQRPVSRLVATIVDQIEAHRALKRDIISHREEMLNLDQVATHLKYISQKHDIVLIRNLMSSIHHRWEKVVSRSSERSRNLDYGYKEAKRFEDMNESLLKEIAEKLAILESDNSIGQTPEKIREQIAQHKEFHCNLGEHNFTYDATRRLGYQLRDKAPLQDRKKIDEIIHNLQVKWQNLCNKSIEREKALNDALLLSGNYKDAMENLLSWLRTIEPKLSDTTNGCCGDINTVQNLLAEHTTLEKQLQDRQHMIEKINNDALSLMVKSEEDSSIIEDQLAELKSTWNHVKNLVGIRRQRLEDARKQALEFEAQWHALKDFFAKAEHDLRQFTISPEEERDDFIVTMIENHRKFQIGLMANEEKINKFQQFGHEILARAHPDAEKPIKHYINIIKSQWSELLGWSEQRGHNLKDHLERLNERKILLDDLLLWLATAEGTLIASESREGPYSLTEAKVQYEEHERFIVDMTEKQKDHDEIVTNSKKKSSLPSVFDRTRRRDLEFNQGLGKIQDAPFVNPRVNQLHSKWKQVWSMILNRRKRLLDQMAYLKEVDNLKSFNFEDWRRRYMSWMNHSKSRVMDFFRRQDTDHDGRVTRKEFIDGIIDSKFQTTRIEMEVVADIFDKNKSGFIDYRQFLAALRPERETYQIKPTGNEREIIHDEVKKQISKCTCHNPYKIVQCGDGKYKFGETEKLRLVRILRSNVMVRIGGGWCALDEFLIKHDPCREALVPEPESEIKGRTNYELREKLPQPKGTIHTMAPFKFKPTAVVASATKKSTIAKIASPKATTSIPVAKTSVTLTVPRTPTGIVSPRGGRRSRIPAKQSSHQSSRTSTRPQSRDTSPDSNLSPITK